MFNIRGKGLRRHGNWAKLLFPKKVTFTKRLVLPSKPESRTKKHINKRILHNSISGIPLMLDLRTRKSNPYVYVVVWAPTITVHLEMFQVSSLSNVQSRDGKELLNLHSAPFRREGAMDQGNVILSASWATKRVLNTVIVIPKSWIMADCDIFPKSTTIDPNSELKPMLVVQL